MLWLLLAAAAAFFLWTRRRTLPVPDARSATVAGLGLLAVLALRSGRLSVALGLGLFALGLMAFWRLDRKTARVEPPAAPPPPGARMTEREAYALLGLAPGANAEAIKQAHRRLMKDAHPDAGGSDIRAARLNAAKDLLLGRG